MKVKLRKIKSNHNNLRTNEIVGHTECWPPQLGEIFVMIGKPLKFGDGRLVYTTPITNVDPIKDNHCELPRPKGRGFLLRRPWPVPLP